MNDLLKPYHAAEHKKWLKAAWFMAFWTIFLWAWVIWALGGLENLAWFNCIGPATSLAITVCWFGLAHHHKQRM